jgi:electron transfer flavoprotein beta subunit
MPSLTQVIKMDVSADGLRCERQAEYGYDTVQVQLPAVISVGDAINEPRYPSLKAIMGAKKKPLDTKSVGDAGIEPDRVGEAGSKVVCGDFKAPPKKEAGQIIEDEDTNETVEKIVAWLDERKLI